MNGIGAPERMATTESGNEIEHRCPDRHLREIFPIVGEVDPEPFELGGLEKLFPSSASKCSVDLGERQDRDSLRPLSAGGLSHPLRARLGDVDLDQSAGIEKEDQRRSSLTISEASLPRFGTAEP